MTTVNKDSVVTLHYTGTLEDGTIFDSSREKEPFTFTAGVGQVVTGFDEAVIGMNVGEQKSVTLTPDQAYGPVNDMAYQVVPKSKFDENYVFEVGATVGGENQGQQFRATIETVIENHIVLNFNHPLAGKDLTFDLEILSVK